jgi:hypothetical protein
LEAYKRKENQIIFSDEDFFSFKNWLKLNIQEVTWQGRFNDEFEEFWKIFFINGLSLEQVLERFEFAHRELEIGPLTTWFNWVKEKFLSFTFIFKKISLLELSRESEISLPNLASILRNFFLGAFPHFHDYFSAIFQIGNVASVNLNVTFSQIKEELDLKMEFHGSQDDEIMPSMEVTLYEEWSIFLKKMKKDLYHDHFNLKKIKARASLKSHLVFVRDIVGILVVGFMLVVGIKEWNLWYEGYLTDKMKVYEPQYTRKNKILSFRSDNKKPFKSFELNEKDLDKVTEMEGLQKTKDEVETQFGTESEVVLTSWDSLPRDFDIADLEHSKYEEFRKNNNRDTRFGNKKVFRVMMKSVDPSISSEKLNVLLKKYKVTRVDNVKPGQSVPGGIYYNIFVPRDYLKEFLAQVMDLDEAILYETRTRGKNPPGKNKVFIWIKNL